MNTEQLNAIEQYKINFLIHYITILTHLIIISL